MRGHLVRIVLAVAGLLVLATPASAQTTTASVVDRAADALTRDPVYVDPQASPGLSQSEADNLRQRISQSEAGPIYIAVLPEAARSESGGSTDEVLRRLARSVRRDGTYVVVVGDEMRAGNTGTLPTGTVPEIASDVVREQSGEGVAAVLTAFVDRIGQVARGEGGAETGGGDGGGSGAVLGGLAVLGLGTGGYYLFRQSKRRREEERRQLEEVREVAMADLVALGDDLRGLDLAIEMPDAEPAAKQDYIQALDAYQKATSQLDRAQRPQDLEPVTAALEEGRYAMERAKARLEGRALPEHRPPCFFDPRHGPSVRDVEWSPDGGAPRRVPACAADALRVEEGEEPMTREITVRGERMPYYDAPSYYGPWAGGYFGGFGLLEGLLIGSLFSHGFGFGGPFIGGGFGGHSGTSGEGDFGGDFGGGDFGGGDFGGGDFGGGDFGGGDFGGQ
ncbi:MAG: hypothetical protein M3164_01830 [Actinomycetota bacterium]|nr:hypothetical protein [Actinomycetota bacterium]